MRRNFYGHANMRLDPVITDWLDSPAAGEDALDDMAALGYITATVIAPQRPPAEAVLEALSDAPPTFRDEAHSRQVLHALESTQANIEKQLETEGQNLKLPCAPSLKPDPDQSDLRSWAIGFMEAHLVDKARWLDNKPETVFQLLLPILLASGLFDPNNLDDEDFEDPGIAEIADIVEEVLGNPGLVDSMCRQIPDVCTELYLFFRLDNDQAP
jgi:uncharacterized protein